MNPEVPRAARLVLGIAPLVFALGCIPWMTTQRSIERDMAKTQMDIERIYQLNRETQKIVITRLNALEIKRKNDSELVLLNLADLEQRVEALRETLGTIRSQIEEIRYRTMGESPDRIPLHVGRGDRASTLVLEGDQLILDGKKALTREDYEAAHTAFQGFLNRFPTSLRAPDAQMWIGDSYYREKKWAQARTAYLVVEQRYVASSRVPEALMKIALCEERTGNSDQAVKTLDRLIRKYPKWEQIERALEMQRRFVKVEPQLPPSPTP